MRFDVSRGDPSSTHRSTYRPTSVSHLEDAVEALDISLSESDMEYLEEPYEPVRVSGHE